MATLTHAESKRLYSCWWNSHSSPKSSKWLQENLADMDVKVKSMIKLIEEDADSFRKRAEMYYKKRPELMKLVEEFYRAYRALAERYDHATGALRQAHRTMAEAFPDQIPLLPDESLSASSVPESGHHTPEYDSDAFKKDAFGISLQSDYSDAVMIEVEDSHKKVANGKARKGWNFVKLDVQEVEEKLNLKNQVTHASEHANKAEIEVENLKIAISKLEAEKKAVFIQQKLYQERISSLEADIMSRQQEVEKLNEEMLVGIAELKNAKDLCHLLEKRNQALQLDVDAFNVKAKKKEEELNMKQEELEKIKVSLKDECQRSMQMEELNCKSQEEVRLLGLEVQEWADKLKHAETRKVDLEEQIRWLKEEIAILNEQNCTYALKIIELQDEISLLEEFKRNHIEENKVLLQELSSIKADKRDLEQRHHELTEQIGVVNFGVESLQSVAKELRDGNLELKEICKKNEVETILHLENLKFMEKITVSNGLLETSLSNANAELEELREKVKTLEESCETLHGKISKHITEKAVLVPQIEAIARNFEILSKTNTLLENSLSDMNVELEGLKGMLNASEESCQSLRDQNIGLIAEKGALIAKVESISHNLKNLESRYTESEGNNLNLNREKDRVLDQVTELQHSLKLEKEEHESLMQTSKSQLAILEHQIYLLQEKGRLREEELDADHKIVHVQMEIFILQKYLSEMKEKNIILAEKFQCKSELISNLELENSIQNERLTLLSQHNEMLVEGINQVRKTLNISKECSSPYDQHFKLILLKIEDLKASLVDAEDDNQHLILEKAVILTLLEQLVPDAARLMSQKDVFEQESKLRYEEVLVLQSESHQMLEKNEQLKQHLQACNRREEVLKEEIETVCEQLADLHEAHATLQSNFGRSFEVNGSLSKQINDLRVENAAVELESNAFLAQRLDFEYLYLVFKSSNADRALELQLLHDNMDHLHKVNCSHEYEIRSLNEKLGAAQVENVNLKEVLLNTEKYKRRLVALENEAKTTRNTCELLSLQVEMGKNLVVQKDVEFQAVQDKNMQLSGTIRGLLMAIDDAKGEKEELEKENHNLIKHNAKKDAEIAQLREANDALNQLLGQLFEETKELKNRDKCLTYELQNRNEEIESCEVEFEALLNDIQITTINVTSFEEKMLDLLIKCESLDISAMIQKEMLYEQITRRTPFEDELKEKLDAVDGENRGGLKEELGAYLPLVLSLEDYVASLKGRIISLANQHSLSNQDQLDSPPSLHQQKSKEERTEDHFAISASGIFELQKLQARVSALEDVVIDIQDHLEQNRSIPNTCLLTTKRQNEELSMGKDIILHLKKREKTGISGEKSEQSIKDIHLDRVLSSSRYDETKDQMMEMWETMVYGEKSESSSFKLASEKELTIDKLELPVSNLEKSGSLSERLSADAQRLAHLHRIAKEIERNMELSELSNSPTNFEFNKVKAQLKEAEGVISHLIDTNKKLRKKDVKLTNDFNDRMGNTSERKVTERAQRGSEKIGRLELELQKLECVWLKLKEEDDYKRARAADRRTRVLLWDYLYGRRENPGMKKVHCCACMRPRTKDD